MFVQVMILVLMLATISLSAPQMPSANELSEKNASSEIQPPPLTYIQDNINFPHRLRSKRCGGGGGCHQPSSSKTYHISITVKKSPAPRPKPIMKHPAPIAVVPVAVVPVYAKPVSSCCGGGRGGGGRGGGGGGKKWHKGK